MMTSRKSLFIGMAFCFISSMIFAGGGKQAQSGGVLKVGILDGWTGFPTKYIVDNGLDVKNGFKIEYMVFSSGAPANEAMVAGELDCSIIGGGATIPALANLDAKMIFETNNDTVGLSLIARPNLACTKVKGQLKNFPNVLGSPETVKGLTIIGPNGTLQQCCALKYLEVLGLSTDDVKFVSMDANQAYQAFMLGEADIFAATNQHAFRLIQEENMVMLCDLQSLNCAATAQVVCSNRAFNNPEKFQSLTKYVTVLAEVAGIMNNDTNLATKSYMDWVSLNGGSQLENVARMIMASKPYYGAAETKARNYGYDLLNNFVEFYIMTGQIEETKRSQIAANVRNDVLKAAGFK
jgi:NitT/TauT family transport system substrate-binding protein